MLVNKMDRVLRQINIVAILFGIILICGYVESCNERECAPVVSKCMLTQSCKCDLKKYASCCKECIACLGSSYEVCCSCIDLCPKSNDTSSISTKSHVEEFEDGGIPALFTAVISDPNNDKWHAFTFPIEYDTLLAGQKLGKDVKYYMKTNEHDLDQTYKELDNTSTQNCTVLYMNPCLSWKKCEHNCRSMGAASYRWFHDGCCECVGLACLNYGINDSKCSQCPEADLIDEEFEEDADYGDQMGPFDGIVDTNSDSNKL